MDDGKTNKQQQQQNGHEMIENARDAAERLFFVSQMLSCETVS